MSMLEKGKKRSAISRQLRKGDPTMNEFISSWSRDIPRLTSGRALPSAVNRPLPRRPHPILSNGGYSDGTGQNATSMFCARALQDSPLGRL